MFEELDKATATLDNAKAGWVTRRDAVEALSSAALRALDVLHRHANEPDVDVRDAVTGALAKVTAAFQGVATATKTYTLDELVRDVAKEGERQVQRTEHGYTVAVRLKGGRSRNVYIVPHETHEGRPLVRVYANCGKARNDLADWALQANLRLTHGAIAVAEEHGEKQFVIMNCFLTTETTPLGIKNSVKEIAYYSDWIESKLAEKDAQ